MESYAVAMYADWFEAMKILKREKCVLQALGSSDLETCLRQGRVNLEKQKYIAAVKIRSRFLSAWQRAVLQALENEICRLPLPVAATSARDAVVRAT